MRKFLHSRRDLTRLYAALRNNFLRSTLDELNAMREKLNAAERKMRRVLTKSPLQDAAAPLTSLIYKHGKTHAQLVDHYTNYYHLWKAQAEAAKRECDAAVGFSDAPNRKQWAEYYSSLSASLAHYHLAISQGGAEPYQRPQSPPNPETCLPGFGNAQT